MPSAGLSLPASSRPSPSSLAYRGLAAARQRPVGRAASRSTSTTPPSASPRRRSFGASSLAPPRGRQARRLLSRNRRRGRQRHPRVLPRLGLRHDRARPRRRVQSPRLYADSSFPARQPRQAQDRARVSSPPASTRAPPRSSPRAPLARRRARRSTRCSTASSGRSSRRRRRPRSSTRERCARLIDARAALAPSRHRRRGSSTARLPGRVPRRASRGATAASPPGRARRLLARGRAARSGAGQTVAVLFAAGRDRARRRRRSSRGRARSSSAPRRFRALLRELGRGRLGRRGGAPRRQPGRLGARLGSHPARGRAAQGEEAGRRLDVRRRRLGRLLHRRQGDARSSPKPATLTGSIGVVSGKLVTGASRRSSSASPTIR